MTLLILEVKAAAHHFPSCLAPPSLLAFRGGFSCQPSRRFSPAVEPRFNFCGADVVEVLERVGRQGGFPAVIRVDQGTEFVSRDLDLWAYQRGVTLDFSRPGKPTDKT